MSEIFFFITVFVACKDNWVVRERPDLHVRELLRHRARHVLALVVLSQQLHEDN